MGQGYKTLLLQLNPGDRYIACPIDSSKHYLAFYTVGLHCQTPTLAHACQAGRQFVPFYDGLSYDPAGTRTHALAHERLTS